MHDRQDKDTARRWSVDQRLAFAANRLFWDGTLQRDDIMRRFGLSPAQATADLAQLRARLGSGIGYDVSRRSYVPGADFAAPPADALALLAELRLIAEGVMPPTESILLAPPPIEVAGLLVRQVEPGVLRAVLWAIRDGTAISADYVSFQRPEVARRVLSPHALVFDGFRWHARAHDAQDGRFKDFLLSRLSDPQPAGAARVGPAGDTAWQRHIVLEIVPHPGLTPHQQSVVARDYGMIEARLLLPVREAIVFYARKRLGLVDGHAERPSAEQQIVLARARPPDTTQRER